jgi:DNA-binding NarL/FixJ family response regulator
MRNLIRTFIDLSDAAVEVTADASGGEDAIRQWRADHPDVIVLDVRMPDTSGLDVAQTILAEDPTQAIVLFSFNLDTDVVSIAEELGVRQCLEKDQLGQLPDILERCGRQA